MANGFAQRVADQFTRFESTHLWVQANLSLPGRFVRVFIHPRLRKHSMFLNLLIPALFRRKKQCRSKHHWENAP
jgi:hypothetical protein